MIDGYDRAERGEHPHDRARPRVRVVGQKTRMGLSDTQHNGAGLEQRETAFLIGRNLPERMTRKMRGLLHLRERQKTNVVRLAHFFERPSERACPAPVLGRDRVSF